MILPTPRYLKNIKVVRAVEIIIPRLVLAMIIEKVKIKDKRIKKKNNGMTPNEIGSAKYTRDAVNIQRKNVTSKVVKKFLRDLISFWRLSFFIQIYFKLLKW